MNAQRPFCRARGWAGLAATLLLLASGCAASSDPSLSALHYFNAGNDAYQAEDYRHAIALYQRALDSDDGSADLFYNLGLAYYRVDAYADAVRTFLRALAIDPNLADAHYNLALAYDKLYNLAAAHHHYNTYLRLVTGQRAAEAATQGTAPATAQAGVPANRAGAQAVQSALAAQAAQSSASATDRRSPAGTGDQWNPARAQRVPGATRGASAQGTAPGEDNPFQGSDKWWTQEPANPNR